MKKKIRIFPVAACAGIFFVLSCTGFREIEKKDKLGRITEIHFYNGNSLERSELIKYYGNSHNPEIVVYKKKSGGVLFPDREEKYFFEENNLSRLEYYSYTPSGNKLSGKIMYYYSDERLSRIEYYADSGFSDELFMFGLDQYSHEDINRFSRRLIEYEYNSETGKAMQIGHFVIEYRDNEAYELKSSVMDRKLKKIIEKTDNNPQSISNTVEIIEKFYNIRSSRGTEN